MKIWKGSFDNWCNSGKEFYGYPKDTDYFTYFLVFITLYDLTDAEYSDTITLISQEIQLTSSVHG